MLHTSDTLYYCTVFSTVRSAVYFPQPRVEYKVTNEKPLRKDSGPRKELSTKKLICSNAGINSS